MDLSKIENKLYYSQLLDIYGALLTKKQYECIQLYYQEDYSLQEIAEIYHITRVAVHNQIQTASKKMQKVEDVLQVYQLKIEYLPKLEDAINNQQQDLALEFIKKMKQMKEWSEE